MNIIGRFSFITLFSLFSIGTLSAPGGLPKSSSISKEERILALSTIWKEASYNFVYFDQVEDLDLDSEYIKYLGKIANENNNWEFYKLLMTFVALLEDGQTSIVPPASLVEKNVAFPAIMLQEIDGKPIVLGVDTRYKISIPLGSQIMSIDGQSVEEILTKTVLPLISASTERFALYAAIVGDRNLGYGLLAGPPDSVSVVTIMQPGTSTLNTVEVKRDLYMRDNYSFLNLDKDNTETISFSWVDNGIAYVKISNFVDAGVYDSFKRFLPELLRAQSIIIDIRGNSGGNSLIGDSILAHFTYKDVKGPASRSRIHNSTYKAWSMFSEQYEWAEKYLIYKNGDAWEKIDPDIIKSNSVPENEKVIVPTFILTDLGTSGAAEDFLIAAEQLGHVTKIGAATKGSSGQPLVFELPLGGEIRICSKRDTRPDGTDYIGTGIIPDFSIRVSVSDVMNGRDTVLLKAKDLAKEEMVASSAID